MIKNQRNNLHTKSVAEKQLCLALINQAFKYILIAATEPG